MAQNPRLTPGYPNKTQVIEYVHEAFIEANQTCTAPWVLSFANPVSSGSSLTLQNIFTIISAVCCILTWLVAIFLLAGHYRNWTVPLEQKQYARIILFLPVFSVCALLSIAFYQADGYIAPGGQWYEGFAICALFLLYTEVIDTFGKTSIETAPNTYELVPGSEDHAKNQNKNMNEPPRAWNKPRAMMVFQIMITRPITVIAIEVIYGITCPLSSKRAKAVEVLTFVQLASTMIAALGCFFTERRFKSNAGMRQQRAFAKLAVFKIIVILEAVQGTVFSFLAGNGTFFPSPPYYISWNDFARGLPQLILSVEVVLSAVGFIWIYDYKQYRLDGPLTFSGSVGTAILQTVNPIDIVKATLAAFLNKNTYSTG